MQKRALLPIGERKLARREEMAHSDNDSEIVFQNARVFAPKAVEGGQVSCRSAGPRKLAHGEHDISMQKHPKNDRRGESGER